MGYADQPDFINAVAEIETGLAPHALLDALLDIEHRHGRVREFRNAPRMLDLDILLYDDLACHEHGLTLPHPRMHERAFVLQPLLEIAPILHHSRARRAAGGMPGEMRCDQRVERMRGKPAMMPDKYRYIVVEGPIGVGKTSLAHAFVGALSGRTDAGRRRRQPVPAPVLPGSGALRAADAAVFPVPARIARCAT